MLDTKLKNRHKLAVVLILLTIMTASLSVMTQYHQWYQEENKAIEQDRREELTSEDFLEQFIEASYILYNTESTREEADSDGFNEFLEEYMSDVKEEFDSFYPYLDYQVKDEDGKVVAKSKVESKQSLSEKNMDAFALGMVITYDENGTPSVKIEKSDYQAEQITELREVLNRFQEDNPEWDDDYYETDTQGMFQTPKDRTYIFAMTEENLQTYFEHYFYVGTHSPESVNNYMVVLMIIVAALAILYPVFPSLKTGEEKIFHAPLEAVMIIFWIMLAVIFNHCGWFFQRNNGIADLFDFAVWILVFAIVYWTASCVRHIYTMGIRRYLKEETLTGSSWKYIRQIWQLLMTKGKNGLQKCYHSLTDIDFREKSNKTILKIVGVNFLILAITCSLWFFGIMALVIYSVVLFLILRKYYSDLQEKYAVLLKATGEIAKGNLDVVITEDLGVFQPFKPEIEKIQNGFKKAVDEEVKSQRMKTELITNVSHDLKTPLTAIITYVDLLKNEKDEEKKKEYIDVLERKSLRLKVLIEDLFEISKASSKNVTLNIIDVDVVNLFKQVKFELEDKIKAANLEFRCTYPEEKVILPLDSQKTYRIFENLLVNIVKYAMPYTRVYVEITKEKEKVRIRMKNVSATELNFNPEELTERFVRGDTARNTEGSGLGLAIAKSFTELQKGKLKIETEADLFKVEVQLGT